MLLVVLVQSIQSRPLFNPATADVVDQLNPVISGSGVAQTIDPIKTLV
jgi:hypothetical protein